jgi:hypothetical protein
VLLGVTLAGVLETSMELWILASVLFLGGVQLISVGILGRYLARVHEQALERPLYLVSRVVRRGEPFDSVSMTHEEAPFTAS